MIRKSFTVDDANQLIPVLDQVFRSIDQKKERVRRHGKKLEVLSLLWEDKVGESGNPDHADYLRHKRAVGKTVSEIEQLIQDEILRRGLRFPAGGIENGLVDFPTTYQGRWVYLCWQAGESELMYWHETDEGFPGRHEITEEQLETMGRTFNPHDIDDSSMDF
jgi:hypothetical protein